MHRTQLSLKQNGNALFYVLLGVVLLAALSYTITRQNVSGGAAQQLSDQQAEIYAAQLINHANAVKAAIDQMLATGSTIDDIDFVLPGEAGYDTAPHIHKVFHPSGGGIGLMTAKEDYFNGQGINRGWNYKNQGNYEASETTANDIIYTFVDINDRICEKINNIITGSTSIPIFATGLTTGFIQDQGSSYGVRASDCPECMNYVSLCVQNVSGTKAFYTIVAAR
jgi:hypothetical protein